MQIIAWDENKAKKELSKRLREASDHRQKFEDFWEKNEQLMYDAEGNLQSNSINSSPEFGSYLESSGLNSAQVNQNSAYAFKNIRYIHSQMSSNPPTVLAEPTTSDPDDRLAAFAADRLVSHGRQTYNLANHIDMLTLGTLTYGIGYLKIVWDSGRGEIIDIDEAGKLVLEGDIAIKIPSVWDIFVDQHAEETSEVRYIFQRIYKSLEEAQGEWPEHAEALEKAATESSDNTYRPDGAVTAHKPGKEVEIYEYWEKGLPENGYDGRYALHLRDGTVLGSVKPNPHRFLAAETVRKITTKYGDMGEDIVKEKLEQIPQRAELPFHILTDIDVPQTVYGKSTLDYVGSIQNNLNRLMLTALDNAAIHGQAKLILPAGSEIAEGSLTNNTVQVIKISGSQGPFHMHMPALLGDLGPMMDREKQQIDDIMGVNESMFGQMKRETANSALQSAAAQGSMIRRRLFNKYTKVVEDIYKQFLKLARKHIELERLYHIIGREHPLEAKEVKTMDLDGGYDLKVTYGASFSLDPVTRRAELMQNLPLFKEAGVPPNVILEMFQLNELRGLYDRNKVGKERQMEIIDEMIETVSYIAPEENQDHVTMLASALEYVMTREFFDLSDEQKELINEHIRVRKEMGAAEIAPTPVLPPMV
jgi:hypothetical protein